MSGFCKVVVLGRLGKDPETRSFANGGSITNLSLATSETWRDKQTGERKERTEWHNVTIRNENIGKIAAQYLRKGDEALIEGTLATRKWQDSSGNDRWTTEIVVGPFNGSLTLVGGGRQRDGGGAGGDAGTGYGAHDYDPPAGGQRQRPSAFDDDLNDDVPF